MGRRATEEARLDHRSRAGGSSGERLRRQLVARGSTSLDEAIQVGILIEEKDITDLSAAITAEDEADVVSVLERLLPGSENHLRSFQRLA